MHGSPSPAGFGYTFSCAAFWRTPMPPITALLHTADDGLRLGRALESLRACDEILIVDQGSRDATLRIAREYGARIISIPRGDLEDGASPARYCALARHDWLFCVEARESLSEGLEASLFEWKSLREDEVDNSTAFSVFLREERASGWQEHSTRQTRLVPRNWKRWQGWLPVDDPSAIALEGELLRFVLP
jgi:glycosyltransferase involved in cell wall biosynthesis